jgi:hypothetical protein
VVRRRSKQREGALLGVSVAFAYFVTISEFELYSIYNEFQYILFKELCDTRNVL